ncbi:apolipophorins [Zerene cesonia]|uniref:apolipophorins n=1 Tax=Zerene cesonia TaxID=33412 RepID=UPI0018E53BD0|nr:apolipophorins [Zerene cesonia]
MGTNSLSFSVILLLTVLWRPALSDKCSIACKGSPSSPSFLNGHTYNYGVEGTVSVYLTGANKQETNVKVFGQVAVTALGNCAHALKVNALAISGPGGKKYPAPKGIDKVVQFSFQDGRVGSQICAEDDDTRASLNIKRAIISLLQTEQKSSTQIDVFGACPTDVSSSQEGAAVLLHRRRDLSRCAYREQGKNDLISAVYNPSAVIKNTQILQSALTVETKVNNGIPEKVAASEDYVYRPFSAGENGARAAVNTKLTLSGTTQGGGNGGNCPESRTIIFENPHQGQPDHSNAQNVLAAIKEACKHLGTEAGSKSAGFFAQLVRIMRSTSKDDLMKVFGQIKGNNLEKRVFLDGLLRAGTGPSIEASIQVLKGKQLSALEEKLVFLSLGNARHVSSDTIKAAAGLLDLPDAPKEIYLGVGALAGVYCRAHECHSTKTEGIIALSKKFAAKLQNCKPKTKVEEDNVVAVLKGIRNIRHLEDSLIDKLVHCANDNNVKARVKVAALEAFHADPCAAKLKKTALDLMKNRQLDSEIRIKAYLAVIACPCGKSANEIKTLLDSEPVHQVGRFITTSLRHIRSSANPDKQLARQHYGLIRTPSKFNVDDRKYSFFREFSYNVDALGAGGTVEEAIIYSQDSFLPRSATYNLTAEIFGHNINVFEIGGRQGNLDRVIEHFIGPRGMFRTQKPQEIYDNLYKRAEETFQKVDGNLRGRRSIKSEVDNFDKNVKAESVPYNNELDLDVYLKLFGTDAVFLSLGDDKGFDFNKGLDQVLKIISDGINKVKHFQQEIRAHLLFLDAELAYPTATGLPIKLDVVGSATGRVDLSTNVDIRQILRSPQNAKVDIKVVPSTDIEVSMIMMVDANAVTAGIKGIVNLHSSTGGHVIAKVIENGQGFDLQLGLPIDKQEIITASNELVFFSAEKGQMEKQTPIKVDSDKKSYSECFDQLSGILGLTLCGEFSVPFTFSGPEAQSSISKFLAKYPVVGPAKIRVALEKNDLRGYHLKGALRTDKQNGKYGVELLFDAEGSQNRRTQINGDVIYNPEEKTVKLSLESPIKTLHGQISFFTKPTEQALLVDAKIDSMAYYGKVGFNAQGNDRRKVWKPILEYELPDKGGRQNLKVDGQLIQESNGPAVRYTLEGIKVNLPNSNEPVNVEGHFNYEPKVIEMDLKAKKGQHNLLLSGSLKGYDVKLEFMNTLNPYVNFKINGHFENAKDTIHNDIDFYYGGDLRDSNQRVTFNQLLKFADATHVITKNKLEIHALPIKGQFDLEYDPKKFDLDLEGIYMNKEFDFEIDARRHIKKDGDYRVKLGLKLDKQAIEVLVKRDIVSADKSNLENYIDIKNMAKYEVSGVVLHRNKANDLNIGAIGHLKLAGGGMKEDINFDTGIIENENLYSAHATISFAKDNVALDFLAKVNRGENPSGQLKLILKDAISANGQFQVTDKEGKGNGVLIVEFKKAQRKIKADVNFVSKAPVFNADVELFLNFEKDNNEKLQFSTNNKRNEKLIDSKNKLQYNGKKTEVNFRQEGVLMGDDKGNLNVEVVLPTERCLNLKINREVTAKDGVYNGLGELLLSDAAKRGGAASIISYKGKLSNTDFEKTFDYEGTVEMRLENGRDLQSNFFLKKHPNGEKFDVKFKGEVSGNLIPKRALIDGSYSFKDITTFEDPYHIKASYGDDLSAEVVGTYVAHFPESGEKKYLDDFTVSLRLPFEKAHDIKFVSTLLYLKPENKDSEVTIIESVQINGDIYKIDGSSKYNTKNGNTKLKLIVPHHDPVVLDVNFKADVEGDSKSGDVEFKAQYGKGKSASLSIQGSSAGRDYELKVNANAPQNDKLKKLVLNLHNKNPTPDTYDSVLSIDADGRVYRSESLMVFSQIKPVFDFKYTSPSSDKVARVYMKGSNFEANHGEVELKFVNFNKFDVDAHFEVGFQNDIFVKFRGNSQTLNLKNYKLDISSKDAGNGKRLEFSAINDNKNVLSGSTSFIKKEEGLKTIIEGSGTLKVKDSQKPANFKFIRTLLTEGSEQGIETFINVAVGELNHVAEARITNLEYKTSYVYCEEKKQCAHAELNSKISMSKTGVIQHLFNVGFDLRKLGVSTEFGLEVSNEFSDKKFPQYLLNLHVNRETDKIHLNAYSRPEFGKFPAGLTMTLPKRVFAVETLVQYPTDKSLPFPIRGEMSLFPDKNRPETKTGARFLVDLNVNDQGGDALAEVGFVHPKIRKEALVRVRGAMQRPSENSVKVSSVALVSHPVLGSDRRAEFNMEASPAHVKIMFDTPVVKVIDLEGSAVMKDNLQQADLRFSLLQLKPVQLYGVVKDYQYYEFSTGYSDEKERKLSIIGHLNPEERVDISVDIVLPGQKKNIVHAALFMKDNQINSDYGISRDNYNHFVTAFKKDLDTLIAKVKEISEKNSNDFKQMLKRVEPKAKELEQAYREDFQKLMEEITNDKTLKELSEAAHDIIQIIAKMIDELVTVTKPLIDKYIEAVTDISKKVCEMYEKQIEPQLKELYDNISAAVRQYLDGVIDAAAHLAAIVIDFFEKHKPEFDELIGTITNMFRDVVRIIVSQMKEFRERSSQLFSEISQQIKEMPLISMIKEKWQELAVPEQVLAILQEGQQSIRGFLPTEELQSFSDVLFNYIQKKLRQEKMDEKKELKVVYEKLVAAATSLVQFVKKNLNELGFSSIPALVMPSLSGPQSFGAPYFGGSAGMSFISQLIQGDIPNPLSLIKAYRPRSLNPLDEVPAKMRAVIVNGQHIFTFDGRHLTFPGSCRYVLAHDHVDRNFTLMMQLQHGNPKSLILEDRSGAIIELKENGQASINGANHGYPIVEKESFAFRQANGRIGLGSLYGVMAFCTSKLEVCYIEVSGFYLGKLRGLLGDGNNEPYDDFRLPNGKISQSESEFGNAYRLAGSCPAVKTPEHSHHQLHAALPPACEAVFGGTSSLRPLSLFLDIAPFRQACIHAASGDDEAALQQACDLARGYAALALTGLLPAALPARCVRCLDADRPRDLGEVYEFRLPAKQADVIVSVEVTKANEQNYKELIVPLVSQVIDALKSKRISDIKVYLVGLTSKYPYPILYDTDLKLKNAKVVFDDESRYNVFERVRTGVPSIDRVEDIVMDIIEYIKINVGATNIMAGYASITELPLRPGAVKHLISSVGTTCEPQFFLVEGLRTLSYDIWMDNNAYSVSVITETAKLAPIGGKPVVGFSENAVLVLGDKKQKDTEALRAKMDIGVNDGCINMAQDTDGFVFSTTSFRELNPAQRKQYLQTAAASITNRMLQYSSVQTCTCTYVDPFRVRSVCVSTEKKEVARKKK